MGCTCRLQFGENPDGEISSVILKVRVKQIVETKAPDLKTEEKINDSKIEEVSTLKPEFLSMQTASQYKLNEP